MIDCVHWCALSVKIGYIFFLYGINIFYGFKFFQFKKWVYLCIEFKNRFISTNKTFNVMARKKYQVVDVKYLNVVCPAHNQRKSVLVAG